MTPSEELREAAETLQELGFGFKADHFWRKDIERARENRCLSVGSYEWAGVMGPSIAEPVGALLLEKASLLEWAEDWTNVNQDGQNARELARLIREAS